MVKSQILTNYLVSENMKEYFHVINDFSEWKDIQSFLDEVSIKEDLFFQEIKETPATLRINFKILRPKVKINEWQPNLLTIFIILKRNENQEYEICQFIFQTSFNNIYEYQSNDARFLNNGVCRITSLIPAKGTSFEKKKEIKYYYNKKLLCSKAFEKTSFSKGYKRLVNQKYREVQNTLHGLKIKPYLYEYDMQRGKIQKSFIEEKIECNEKLKCNMTQNRFIKEFKNASTLARKIALSSEKKI